MKTRERQYVGIEFVVEVRHFPMLRWQHGKLRVGVFYE